MPGLMGRGKRWAMRMIDSRVHPGIGIVPWVKVRLSALRGLRPIYRGVRVEWDLPGHARTVPFEVCGPSRHEVLLRSIVSAVSLGTERAFFSVEANATGAFPQYPGYSLVGEVLRTGSGVKDLKKGQIVAVQAAHGSLAVAPREQVFPLPEGVRPEEGAFLYLGVIALQGVWRGELQPGERVAVLGRGPIGQLTAQLSQALGAGEVLSIAPTRRHCTPELESSGQRIIVTSEENEDILDSIQADVTYECSGQPKAINDAVRATRDGGRVVLLGSPRGATKEFDFGQLADRSISLLGAHVSNLPTGTAEAGRNYKGAAETVLRLLADKSIDVAPLTSTEVNPWESGGFYRRLSQNRHDWVGACFRWDRLQDDDRSRKVAYWTLPESEMAHGSAMTRLSFTKSHSEAARPVSPARKPTRRRTGITGTEETLRIAVVGCGGRGGASTINVQNARYTSLAIVMDIDRDQARQTGESLGVPWTGSYEEVLDDRSVDAVFINTPHHLHAEQAIMAAAAGKHIIVEKPLAHTLEAATRIVGAAKNAGVGLSVWLGRRYYPQVVKAKGLLSAGALGSLLGASVTHNLYHPPFYWERGNDGTSSDWRSRVETGGGGVLIMNSIYYLDWLLYLTGLDVVEVSARSATLQGDAEVEDSLVMWLTFENGSLATFNSSSCVHGLESGPELAEFRMWGTEGHLSLTPPFQFFSSNLIDGKRPERWHALTPLPKLRSPNIEFLERFSLAVLSGKPVDISGEDGLKLQAVIEAAYISSRDGRTVQVSYPQI